jgi:hypothetical protein
MQLSEHANTLLGNVDDLNRLNSEVIILHEEIPEPTQPHQLALAMVLCIQSLFCCGANIHSDSTDNNKLAVLNDQATFLLARLKKGGQHSDLDDAIAFSRRALELCPPPHSDQPTSLHNLANALQTQYEQKDQQHDLDESISLHRQAPELYPSPHPSWPIFLNNLATALQTRFEQQAQQQDLDESIFLRRQALELCSSLHPDQSISFNCLAKALLICFEQKGQQCDLDESIFLHRQALELQPSLHPNQATFINNLANALQTRFEQKGHQHDLNESIFLYRQVLELHPPPHPQGSISLNNLAIALQIRFEQGGQQHDIDESISLHRQALELHPQSHPDRLMYLNNLAASLQTRYEQGGKQYDLDESIFFHRQALEHRSPPRPTSLNNFANALLARYKQRGQQHDLDESISLHRQALELYSPSHLNRSALLNNLAIALLTQYEIGSQQHDLDESISLHRQALELRSLSHPDRGSSLNNLANALQTRYEQEGSQYDLDETISLHRQSLELHPLPHPDRSMSLNNLANALRARYELEGQQHDLDEGISLYNQALELRPSSHPDRAESLYAMGKLLLLSHSEKDDNSEDLDQAMSLFFAATQCPSQIASQRYTIAITWIYFADFIYQHSSAFDAYNVALQTLPQLAALNLDIQSRQKTLSATSDALARDASKCAIQAGNLGKAIEFLEAGRTVFWSQLLSVRSPFDELQKISPELANQLNYISTALELGSYRNMSVELLDNKMRLAQDQETSQLNRLYEEWEKTINSIRCLEGFKDFLQPHQFLALQAAASEFPVVSLIANETDSNILIMTSTNVHHIPLPTLPAIELYRLVQLIQAAASHSKIQRSSVDIFSKDTSTFSPVIQETLQNWINMEEKRGRRKFPNKINSDDIFKSVLKTLWDDVVKPIIAFLGLKVSL